MSTEVEFSPIRVAVEVTSPSIKKAVKVYPPALTVLVTVPTHYPTASVPGHVQTLNVVNGMVMGGAARTSLSKDLSDGCVTTAKIAANAVTSDKVDSTVFVRVTAPANATDAGTVGQIAFSGGQLYICTGTNSWARVAIAAWA